MAQEAPTQEAPPLPLGPAQIRAEVQPRRPSKKKKIVNWFKFTILIALIPLAILAGDMGIHGNIPTWAELFKNGELIAISIAIFGETMGELNLNEVTSPTKERLMFTIGLIGLAACVTLSYFIALANCRDQHPTNASQVCAPLFIPTDAIIYTSIAFYALSVGLGFLSKRLEKE